MACSDWEMFDESLKRAKQTLERNQYPPEFYDPIITTTIEKLVSPEQQPPQENSPSATMVTTTTTEPNALPPLKLEYRGRVTDNVVRRLSQGITPIRAVITLRKLKTALPSLKLPVPKVLQSRIVYQMTYPGCASSYVGQTVRHLKVRLAEHGNPKLPVGAHFQECIHSRPSIYDVKVLAKTSRGSAFLETLEALFINELHPSLNTKDEYRSRVLTLKF